MNKVDGQTSVKLRKDVKDGDNICMCIQMVKLEAIKQYMMDWDYWRTYHEKEQIANTIFDLVKLFWSELASKKRKK